MTDFIQFILDSEEILMEKTLQYAKDRGYTKYTSTLKEAWRLSISGLSKSLVKVMEKGRSIPEMGPDDDYSKDEIAEFGITEARKHRSRGVTIVMFLSLMKYYQQAYTDLIRESNFSAEDKEFYCQYVNRYFDHVELGFTNEWAGLTKSTEFEELQESNRRITNEKNKYLTVFESIYDPIVLVDKDNHIENINHRVAEVFLKNVGSGRAYYNNSDMGKEPGWLMEELEHFSRQKENEKMLERTLDTNNGRRTFLLKLRKMLDISEKYSGTVVICYDITERMEYEKELKIQQDKLEEYAYKDQLTGAANRRTGLMTLKKELSFPDSNNSCLSVCFLDIDGLKKVNDTYGHAEGDELIKVISSALKKAVSHHDCVCRMGGDEFLIILPGRREKEADQLILQVNSHLDQYDAKSGKPYRHSFSYGIEEVSKDQNRKANDILIAVDVKMYQNKAHKKLQSNNEDMI